MTTRGADVGRARWLSIASVGWGLLAAVAGAVVGVSSGSLAVVGFAIDSAIDTGASIALAWRFATEARDPARAVRLEHLAERIVGWVLMVAAAALGLGAARALLAHEPMTPSTAQLVLLVASLVILPPLAVSKHRVARRLGSVALRNDALLTGAAAILAAVALLAVALDAAGVWWADAAGSIVIAVFLAREGWASVGWGRSHEGESHEEAPPGSAAG